MIAKIAVSAATFAIDKPYSYFVPRDMQLQPGMRVIVPFGKGNRRSEGVVLAVEEGQQQQLKSVELCLDDTSILSETMLRLAAFMRQRYFCTFFDAIRAMLPAGLWFQTKQVFYLTEDRSWEEKHPKKAGALELLQLLDALGGQAAESDLAQSYPGGVPEDVLEYLLKKKFIRASTDFQRRTTDKTQSVATLAVSTEEALSFAAGRPKSAMLQKSVLELLCGVGSASVKEICYYTGAKPGTVKRLAELGFVELSEKEVLRCRQIQPVTLDGPLVLNEQQQAAYEGLCSQMEQADPGAALLYGVTGSGKTSVYIQLIRACLAKGKQAILLVPEIALTPQLLGLLAAHFDKQVAVLHSSLPAGERYDQWKRIRSGEAAVVVGTRSAVFAPCQNLGMIILDEEQEHSYKSENSPRYDAKQIALWRGVKENALVLMGSATPSVETMYHAKTGTYRLYTLNERFNGKPLPKVQIVDMRKELELGNDLSLSYDLRDAIGINAQAGKQSILFLNRRGNSRALVCVDCGEAPECPRCSARLTYHSANERLMCHYCGFSQEATRSCPKCGGAVKRVGTGTQKVQEELQQVYPEMEIDRMDADTVGPANTHEQILAHFKDNRVPVLIGTQMVAKGLNLPDVTLVGVLDADLSLYVDSYRAAETTFNMLTQVVGRAGRGDTSGEAYIQTMTPAHKVITLAAKQDYESFYEMELQLRRLQSCPPFGDVTLVTFSALDEAAVLRGSTKFAQSLLSCLRQPEYAGEICAVLGPAACPVAKINYNYRYRLTLRCRMTPKLRQLLAHILRQFSQDRENRGISAYVDVNGFE